MKKIFINTALFLIFSFIKSKIKNKKTIFLLKTLHFVIKFIVYMIFTSNLLN